MSTTQQPAVSAGEHARTGRRARRFARLWRMMDDSIDKQIRPAKSRLFTELPRQVVEVGPGCGANFAYFPAGTKVIAFEPNVHFHANLRAAAAAQEIELDLHASGLGAGELPEGSQDLVVSTLVLCSVGDVEATLREISRILRPGGRLLFIEHVAARPGTAAARYQRLVRRPWQALGDGCDPCADTMQRLAKSGLTLVDTHLERLGSPLDPTSITYWGAAVRPDRPSPRSTA